MRRLRLVLFATILSPAALFAQNEIAVLASAHGGGGLTSEFAGDPELDSTAALALMVGLDRGTNRRLDFVYARQEGAIEFDDLTRPPGEARVGLDIDYLQLGGRVLFQPQTRIVPYIAMTVGIARFTTDDDSAIRPAGAIGAGVDLVLARSVALRLDGRLYGTLTGGDVSVSTGGGELVGIGSGNGFSQFAASAGVVVRLP